MPEEPRPLWTKKLLDKGPDNVRANLVLVAEGYQLKDERLFERQCRTLVSVIKREEWFERMPVLNVHAVMVASREPGPWIPYGCPARPRRTPFRAAFCGNGRMLRLVTGDMPLAKEVAREAVPEVTCTGVLINNRAKGGTGGQDSWWCTAGRRHWYYVALHELGHGMFRLADEYDGEGEYRGTREPSAPNVTIETDREKVKWRHLISRDTQLPTLMHGEQPRSMRERREVGLFEGAQYRSYGIFRPQWECRMRASRHEFCDVCEEHIVKVLTPYADEIPDGPDEIMSPTVPVVPDTGEGETTVVRPRARIEVRIGTRTMSWPDNRAGTNNAIDFLRRRHP